MLQELNMPPFNFSIFWTKFENGRTIWNKTAFNMEIGWKEVVEMFSYNL